MPALSTLMPITDITEQARYSRLIQSLRILLNQMLQGATHYTQSWCLTPNLFAFPCANASPSVLSLALSWDPLGFVLSYGPAGMAECF